ncbi:MAG: GNAT family N-acetyltransferase [Eubacteriales bacterium]|nr:GNAT family N-acetyltransferase [Eubacteriales bacterium]
MITFCKDKRAIIKALNSLESSDYLKAVVNLYLEAYGAKYSFCEFFIEYKENIAVALILRYNSFLYCITDEKADLSELSMWISGFENSQVYVDRLALAQGISGVYETCYELKFKNNGERNFPSSCKTLEESFELKNCAKLVCRGKSIDITDEFYLDLSHMVRHGNLSVFGIYHGDTAVSVAGVSLGSEIAVINFLITDEYFRGNGFARQLLHDICNVDTREYLLLSSESNLDFYSKCGFITQNKCYLVKI